MSNIAVIRIRGQCKTRETIKGTLNMLNLFKKNFCVVLPNDKNVIGMVDKVKDFVTWGEIDDDTLKLLKDKRDEGKKFFRLNNPRGGFERKGVKQSFSFGGVLGYRGVKINDLIKRMI